MDCGSALYLKKVVSVEKINRFEVNAAAGSDEGCVEMLSALKRSRRQRNRENKGIFVDEAAKLWY